MEKAIISCDLLATVGLTVGLSAVPAQAATVATGAVFNDPTVDSGHATKLNTYSASALKHQAAVNAATPATRTCSVA